MKKIYIIGNWKMKITSLEDAKEVFVKENRTAGKYKGVQSVICAPFVYLAPLAQKITSNRMVLGAQDVFIKDTGAYTGEISPVMLTDLRVKYALVGHSERRALGETDALIAEKIISCLKNAITPILCVGEEIRDKKEGHYAFLKKQIKASLQNIPKEALNQIIFAYEPIWAISSTENQRDATPEDAREMALFIKKTLADLYTLDQAAVKRIRVLYGGSANKDNAGEFLACGEIDGLLAGTASVDPKNFGEMIKIAGGMITEE
jgi:triosephosphate isomerase